MKAKPLLLSLLFVFAPFTGAAAQAQTFENSLPSFGLYCEQNADIRGNVKYVVDENADAVMFSEYRVDCSEELYLKIPFISNAYSLPDIDIAVDGSSVAKQLYYGDRFFHDRELRFYSSDIDNLKGTLYTVYDAGDGFTVSFEKTDDVNFIYRFSDSIKSRNENGAYTFTVGNTVDGMTYEIFVINGDFTNFDCSARTVKEALTAKEYIDRYADGNTPPEFFYALINSGMNYDFFYFFYDSPEELRVNAYEIHLKAEALPCVVSYSPPVDVQVNRSFQPAIYMAELTTAGGYPTGYTIELNDKLPYIIQSGADVEKQDGYLYTADGVSGDFFFVFSSAKKPQTADGNKNDVAFKAALTVICVLAGCIVIASAVALIFYFKGKI